MENVHLINRRPTKHLVQLLLGPSVVESAETSTFRRDDIPSPRRARRAPARQAGQEIIAKIRPGEARPANVIREEPLAQRLDIRVEIRPVEDQIQSRLERVRGL